MKKYILFSIVLLAALWVLSSSTANAANWYTISAYDAAGNNSAQSTSASATTQAASGTVRNAASCSLADVTAAYNVASDGDTVITLIHPILIPIPYVLNLLSNPVPTPIQLGEHANPIIYNQEQ